MARIYKYLFGLLGLFHLSISTAIAQGNGVDLQVNRHKWEVNINLLPVFKLSTPDWSHSYLIKRNLGNGDKLSAIRFTASPHLIARDQNFSPSTFTANNPKTSYFNPSAVLGYEWQKVKGRFGYFYGIDFGWKAEFRKYRDNNVSKINEDGSTVHGKVHTVSTQNAVWIAPLLGGKYYLNHRFGISLESQFRPIFSKYKSSTKFNDVEVSREVVKAFDISVLGSYMLSISYNL